MNFEKEKKSKENETLALICNPSQIGLIPKQEGEGKRFGTLTPSSQSESNPKRKEIQIGSIRAPKRKTKKEGFGLDPLKSEKGEKGKVGFQTITLDPNPNPHHRFG